MAPIRDADGKTASLHLYIDAAALIGASGKRNNQTILLRWRASLW